jgi:AcrR family transcriptional regulator
VAGASPSSVYNLFDGLPSLTVALLARTFGRLFAHLASRVLAEDRPDAAVRALVDGLLQWVLGHEDEARRTDDSTARKERGNRNGQHGI